MFKGPQPVTKAILLAVVLDCMHFHTGMKGIHWFGKIESGEGRHICCAARINGVDKLECLTFASQDHPIRNK